MDTNILLESGTNELEVLEFTVKNRHYGINVAKVREIITYQDVTPVPHAHPSIEGIFMPREAMITAIDLKNCLGMGESEPGGGLFIITNFNSLDIAFHVDTVLGIQRVSWADIMKPSSTAASAEDGLSTGIIKKNNKIIIILDFEKIVADINPEIGLKMTDVKEYEGRKRIDIPILIAEDSGLLNKLIVQSLDNAGYKNVISTENGQQAWDLLEEWNNAGTVKKNVQCVITDIEMPVMDGHRLTKLIKTTDGLRDLKVIIFSSMINDQLRVKGEKLGADAQLTKPEIGSLVAAIDKLLEID